MMLDARTIAQALGGDVSGNAALVPGPVIRRVTALSRSGLIPTRQMVFWSIDATIRVPLGEAAR